MQDNNIDSDSHCETLPDDPAKRETMQAMAAAAVGVQLFSDVSWWPFGDADVEDVLQVLNNGDLVDDEVETLNFGSNVKAELDGGEIKITIPQSFSGDFTVSDGTLKLDPAHLELNGGGHIDGPRRIMLSDRDDDGDKWLVEESAFGEFRVALGDMESSSGMFTVDTDGSTRVYGDTTVDSLEANPGSSGSPTVKIGSGGAGFYVNSSGEVVVIDEAGNETTIS